MAGLLGLWQGSRSMSCPLPGGRHGFWKNPKSLIFLLAWHFPDTRHLSFKNMVQMSAPGPLNHQDNCNGRDPLTLPSKCIQVWPACGLKPRPIGILDKSMDKQGGQPPR